MAAGRMPNHAAAANSIRRALQPSSPRSQRFASCRGLPRTSRAPFHPTANRPAPAAPHSFTALRILRGLPQIINGGRFFDKDGNRVVLPGERYATNGVRLQLPQAPER